MFKTLIGHGHPEFSTNRQQDAQEFFLHLFTTIDRTEVSVVWTFSLIDLFQNSNDMFFKLKLCYVDIQAL